MAQKCYCGADNCRGFLGQTKQAPPITKISNHLIDHTPPQSPSSGSKRRGKHRTQNDADSAVSYGKIYFPQFWFDFINEPSSASPLTILYCTTNIFKLIWQLRWFLLSSQIKEGRISTMKRRYLAIHPSQSSLLQLQILSFYAAIIMTNNLGGDLQASFVE